MGCECHTHWMSGRPRIAKGVPLERFLPHWASVMDRLGVRRLMRRDFVVLKVDENVVCVDSLVYNLYEAFVADFG